MKTISIPAFGGPDQLRLMDVPQPRAAYAEFAVVPAARLVKVPLQVPLNVATALMLQGCTAHYLSHSAFPLAAGKSCRVHAAAGGVGQLLTQLAKLRAAAGFFECAER